MNKYNYRTNISIFWKNIEYEDKISLNFNLPNRSKNKKINLRQKLANN